MARKQRPSTKRPARKNAGPGNPARAQRSTHRLGVERAIAGLRGEYMDYVKTLEPAFGDVEAELIAGRQLSMVGASASAYAEADPGASAFFFAYPKFSMALAHYMVNLPPALSSEAVYKAWLDYLGFLESTQRWQGTAAQLEDLRRLLEQALYGPDIAQSAARARLLAGSPVAAKVRELAQALKDGITREQFADPGNPVRQQLLRIAGADPKQDGPDSPVPAEFVHLFAAASATVLESDEQSIRTSSTALALLDGPARTENRKLYDALASAYLASCRQFGQQPPAPFDDPAFS